MDESDIYPHYLTTIAGAGASVIVTHPRGKEGPYVYGHTGLSPEEFWHYFENCATRLFEAKRLRG